MAVVTGGDSGIGRATAVLFAHEGARIAFLYKDEEKDARETEELVKEEGGEVFSMAGDVGESHFVERFIDTVIERFGKIDVLVNNAAEQHHQKELTDISDEQLQRTYQTNIFGMFNTTRAALPHLKSGASHHLHNLDHCLQGAEVLMD